MGATPPSAYTREAEGGLDNEDSPPRAWRVRWERWAKPQANGLPSIRLLLAFPIAVFVVLIAASAFSINGSSSSVIYQMLFQQEDPRVIVGTPQQIRSDEFGIGTPFAISQTEASFAVENDSLPGGVDMTIGWNAPIADWPVLFKPNLWGYFIAPFQNAFAFDWWMPGALLVVATYLFFLTLWPGRPLAAAAISVGFFFTPLFSWWYGSNTFYVAAWAMAVMTATMWCGRLTKAWQRWILAVPIAYLSVTAGMALYVPFLLPCAYVAVGFALAWALGNLHSMPIVQRLRRLLPVVAGGAGAGVTLGVYLATRWSTVEEIMGTVYPGNRTIPPGATYEPNVTIGRVFGNALFGLDTYQNSTGSFWLNYSESSSVLLLGLFLIVVGAWSTFRRVRAGRRIDMALVVLFLVVLLFAAYIFVPGWDGLAHLLRLDLSSPTRILMGVGVACMAMIGLVVHDLEEDGHAAPWWVIGLMAAGMIGVTVYQWADLRSLSLPIPLVGSWLLFLILMVVAGVAFSRRKPTIGAISTCAILVGLGGWVNPICHGVLDLRETEIGKEVLALDAADPGRWVGLGDLAVNQVLVETSVGAFNSLQNAPESATWDPIDPTGEYSDAWNRLGTVRWFPRADQPRISTPSPDQIQVSFDSCASYEQEHFVHVLAPFEVDQPCLSEVSTVSYPGVEYHIYRVVPGP